MSAPEIRMVLAVATFGPEAVSAPRILPGDFTSPRRRGWSRRVETDADRRRRERHYRAAWVKRCAS